MPFIPDPDERPAEPSGVGLAIYLLVAESVQKNNWNESFRFPKGQISTGFL